MRALRLLTWSVSLAMESNASRLAKREALLSIASETDHVSRRSARKGVSYLEDFYDVIDNPKHLKKKIIEVCR